MSQVKRVGFLDCSDLVWTLGLTFGPVSTGYWDSDYSHVYNSRLFPIDYQSSNPLFSSAYVLLIEAHDENGNPGISQVARVRLVITVEDVNDMPPLFKQRKYEGFMSSDLSRLRNNLQVEAVDLDKTGTVNSDVRYEIIISSLSSVSS